VFACAYFGWLFWAFGLHTEETMEKLRRRFPPGYAVAPFLAGRLAIWSARITAYAALLAAILLVLGMLFAETGAFGFETP